MKYRRLLAVISAALIIGGLLLAYGSKAHADNNQVSTTFTGFAFEKSTVTASMKAQVQAWLDANPGYVVASCIGFTGHNVNKRTQTFLTNLANTRAKNICSFISKTAGTITIHSTKGIPGNGQTPAARKVQVTLYKAIDNGGSGIVTIGVCDNSLTAKMQSRIQSGSFAFDSITVKDISKTCKNDVLDIYFLDASGNQIASALNNKITTTSIRVSYTLFNPTLIASDQIAKVAFELRVN
jgi:hypothetical protein